MPVGFRKSLFGFNSNDVVEYIEKLQRNFNFKENSFNERLSKLREELNRSNEICETLAKEKQEIQIQLDEFNAKYDEIERISENIGKLYLVAQTNSKAIMENSRHSAQITDNEIERNINSIKEAHNSLKALRQKITTTSDNFVEEVNSLIASLDATREQISQNQASIEEAKNEFSEVFTSITE